MSKKRYRSNSSGDLPLVQLLKVSGGSLSSSDSSDSEPYSTTDILSTCEICGKRVYLTLEIQSHYWSRDPARWYRPTILNMLLQYDKKCKHKL